MFWKDLWESRELEAAWHSEPLHTVTTHTTITVKKLTRITTQPSGIPAAKVGIQIQNIKWQEKSIPHVMWLHTCHVFCYISQNYMPQHSTSQSFHIHNCELCNYVTNLVTNHLSMSTHLFAFGFNPICHLNTPSTTSIHTAKSLNLVITEFCPIHFQTIFLKYNKDCHMWCPIPWRGHHKLGLHTVQIDKLRSHNIN